MAAWTWATTLWATGNFGHWELGPPGTWATGNLSTWELGPPGNLGHRELGPPGTWATWELGPLGTWATGNLGTWELGPPGNLGHWELGPPGNLGHLGNWLCSIVFKSVQKMFNNVLPFTFTLTITYTFTPLSDSQNGKHQKFWSYKLHQTVSKKKWRTQCSTPWWSWCQSRLQGRKGEEMKREELVTM